MKKEELEKECIHSECDGNCDCKDHCDHDHDNLEPIIVEMEDLDGVKVKVEIVATFEDTGKTYAIANDLDNTDNSYIFEVQPTEKGDMLISVDDEEEFERLCKVVEELSNK